jgi:ketosteroid isomerase-like protein
VEDNKAPVLRYIRELANGDVDIADEIFTPDFVYHLSTAEAQLEVTRDQYVGAVRGLFRVFPDWRAEAIDVVAEGSLVIDRVSVTATHTGGPAPTGEAFKAVQVVHVWRVEAARLKELWLFGSPTFHRMMDLMRR